MKIKQYLEIIFLFMAHNEWDLIAHFSENYSIQLLSSLELQRVPLAQCCPLLITFKLVILVQWFQIPGIKMKLQ